MLKELTELLGVSGNEGAVRSFIENEIKDFCTSLRTDSMGNLIAFKKASVPAEKTVLLSAHMDEVGFIVTGITDDGYLKFDSVGGIDPKILVSQRVTNGSISGVIALKAIHLTAKAEREKPVTLDMLHIDIGAADKAGAERYVTPGDCFGFLSDYVEFGSMIKAKALDDRVGCSIMIDILKSEHPVNLYCAFTVQEEVGLRGARIAAHGINPDFAVVIEGTTCSDMTATPENLRVTKSGSGAAISVIDSASRADGELVSALVKTAKRHGIKHQYKAAAAGGNDAGALYVSNGGMKTASISVPCRYIHSPVCVMNRGDFESCGDIVKAFLNDFGKDLI